MDGSKPERLLTAALEEFKARGYEEATMAGIATRAGMATGSIYKYFPSKQALFESLQAPELSHVKPHFEKRRRQIIDKGLEVFSKKGFKGTTMEDIAQGLDFSKAAIYQYFTSKEELFNAVFEENRMSFYIESLGLENSAATLSSVFEALGLEYIRMFNDEARLNLLRTLFSETSRCVQFSNIMYEQTIKRGLDQLALFLSALPETGHTSPEELKSWVKLYLGMLSSAIIIGKLFSIPEEQPDDAAVVREALDLFMNGVKSKLK